MAVLGTQSLLSPIIDFSAFGDRLLVSGVPKCV
jgi:hypothetical protein